jgi:LCP family protein required for cell wall assembly
MKSKKFLLKIGIAVLVIGVLVVSGVIILKRSFTGQPLPSIRDSIGVGTSLNPMPTREPVEAAAIKPACGGPTEMVLLMLGIDENEQSDAIRLVRVDFVEQKIVVLSIPRDFWVPIPGFSDHGITENRINAAYGYGEYYKVEGGGVAAVANTIYYNYGIEVDHYVVFHFDHFEKVIDKIGGVDIVLDKAVFGVGGNPYFEEGKHHFDGKTAMSFVRIRETDTDIQRIDRQTLVLIEVLKKIKDSMNVSQLVSFGLDLVKDKTILTDVDYQNMYSLACLGNLLDGEDVVFMSIPNDMYKPFTTTGGANVRVPEPEMVPFIQKVMSGEIEE